MPVGPYGNFAACKRGIKAQYKKRGRSISDASVDRICGAMEHQNEAPCPVRYRRIFLEAGVEPKRAEEMAEDLYWYTIQKIEKSVGVENG